MRVVERGDDLSIPRRLFRKTDIDSDIHARRQQNATAFSTLRFHGHVSCHHLSVSPSTSTSTPSSSSSSRRQVSFCTRISYVFSGSDAFGSDALVRGSMQLYPTLSSSLPLPHDDRFLGHFSFHRWRVCCGGAYPVILFYPPPLHTTYNIAPVRT